MSVESPMIANVRVGHDLIDGEFIEPGRVLSGTLDDPNTGAVRGPQTATDQAEVDRAVAAAALLHEEGRWQLADVETRRRFLDRIADGIDARAHEFGHEDAMATGNPITTASQIARFLGARVRAAGTQLAEFGRSEALPADGRPVRLLRLGLGPVAVLAPWNAPTFVAVAKVASALAAGCPVILKPSEWAPGGCEVLAEVIADAARGLGLPSAVFQLVHGGAEVGAQLAGDKRVRAISFTGGATGGRSVAVAAAPNFTTVQLELGGHNPAVILDDADIELTAAALAEGMTKLNGQWCEAPGKVLVPEVLHDELVDALAARLGTLRVGHCLDKDTEMGPLAHAAHRNRLRGQIAHLVREGGREQTTADIPDLGGWFMSPTLVTGLPATRSVHELFGPVVSVHGYAELSAALRDANGPETGLAGFVFGGDEDRALQVAARLTAGEIRVNGTKLADLADGSQQTFWGNAGVGGHGDEELIRLFQGRRTVGVDSPDLPI